MNQTLGENERLPPIFGEPGAAGGDQQQGAAGGDQQGGVGHQGPVGGVEEVGQAAVVLLIDHHHHCFDHHHLYQVAQADILLLNYDWIRGNLDFI